MGGASRELLFRKEVMFFTLCLPASSTRPFWSAPPGLKVRPRARLLPQMGRWGRLVPDMADIVLGPRVPNGKQQPLQDSVGRVHPPI